MTREVYLDNAATTKISKNVAEAMTPYLGEDYGNPSSVHEMGVKARKSIEESRKIISSEIGAKSNEIIFTGSGTEANNLALKGLFFENYPEKDHLVVSKIEHDSILETCKWLEKQGAKISYLDVDKFGFISKEDLDKAINDKTFLVSIIHGNNEIGTIQNLRELGEICKSKNVLFHTDACQSFKKVPIDVEKDNIDLMTLNAHKIHGPKGVGVLYMKGSVKISPLLHGGGQEFGLRSSTENVPGIIGFGEAVKESWKEDVSKMENLRDYILDEMLGVEGVSLNGPKENRLCNNLNLSFKGIEAESLAAFLNEAGIYVSTGSACSSNSSGESHVLLAIGLGKKEASSTIRISLSRFSSKEDAEYLLSEVKKNINKLRGLKI